MSLHFMTSNEIAQQKDELRRQMRARREALSNEERIDAAQKIAHRVLDVVPQNAKTIALYLANKNEANLDAALQTLIGDERIVVAPRAGVRPRFARLTTTENLRTNARGLRFPDSDEQFAAWEIDVVIVPGVAFDLSGNRLGQGGGWYDKTLERARAKNPVAPLVIGVCYECQMIKCVPQDRYDQRVDMIVTEDRVLDVRAK